MDPESRLSYCHKRCMAAAQALPTPPCAPAAPRPFRRRIAAVAAAAVATTGLSEHPDWYWPTPLRSSTAFAFATGLHGTACSSRSGFRSWHGGIIRCKAAAEEVASLDLDDDLSLDGDLEDDWETGQDEEEQEEGTSFENWRSDPKLSETKQRLGISDEEASLWEEGVEGMKKEGKIPDSVRERLQKFADPKSLRAFDTVGGGGSGDKWLKVPLNDTWTVEVAQVPGGGARFIEMMRGTKEVDDNTKDILQAGDSVWPASIILARWLCIQPPPVLLEGRAIIEIGSGLGLTGVVAASLGAQRVLLQDRDEYSLREALETSVSEGVAERMTTLRCNWEEIPAKLMAGQAALAPFGQPDIILAADVILNEAAAEHIAAVLQILLRTPEQVAYFMEPYKRPHRKLFMTHCQSLGLTVQEEEIVTWEPDWDNYLENDQEWVMRLLTVRAM